MTSEGEVRSSKSMGAWPMELTWTTRAGADLRSVLVPNGRSSICAVRREARCVSAPETHATSYDSAALSPLSPLSTGVGDPDSLRLNAATSALPSDFCSGKLTSLAQKTDEPSAMVVAAR
jgi:hypothetical protein